MARKLTGIAAYRDTGIERVRGERERERERERKKTSKTRGDYASTIREQRYVSEPIETRVFKFLTVDCIRELWDLNS
jgi:hypothetical protein